jgi:hypothetical protein
VKSVSQAQQRTTFQSLGDLAELVFCSPLQPSQCPTAQEVRDAVLRTLRREADPLAACAAHVASCYGDDPEGACARMRWARSVVMASFRGRDVAA